MAVQAIVRGGLPAMRADAVGRGIQGVPSGAGFIGAGAPLHGHGDVQVRGLATAASNRVSAALAVWPLIGVDMCLALIVLFAGAPIERAIRDQPEEQDRVDMDERP